MSSKTTRRFRQELAKLPRNIRQQARTAYRLFGQNPNHPRLRFKKIHTTEPIYSARINADYRAVGIIDNNQIVWFWIGPHTDYEKLLKQL